VLHLNLSQLLMYHHHRQFFSSYQIHSYGRRSGKAGGSTGAFLRGQGQDSLGDGLLHIENAVVTDNSTESACNFCGES